MVREALTLEGLNALAPGEAAALFIARRAEGLTEQEQVLFASWLGADEAHRHAFDCAERAWRAFDGAEGDEILAAMRAHALAPRRRAWLDWRHAAAAAAVLLLVVGSAVWLLPEQKLWRPEGPPPAAALQYASARGEVKAIGLPDGSEMTLDADSAATARFDGAKRSIQLTRGRAFFTVAKDKQRPFAVTAADQRVVAVGTRFDVSLAPDTVTVTLLEGKVTVGPVGASATSVTLEPGQQFVRRRGHAAVRALGPQAESAAAWRSGLISFDDQSLGEAAAVMNRYSQDQIVIRDAAVASKRVSGQFRAGEAERFARTLAEVHGLRVVRRGGEIDLVR